MPSTIDPTFLADGSKVAKADLRGQLAAIKSELEHGGFVTDPTTGLEATASAALANVNAALGGASAGTHAVTTIADLRGLAPEAGKVVVVLGYHAPGDGGGGLFYADLTSALQTDGGTCFAHDGDLVVKPTYSNDYLHYNATGRVLPLAAGETGVAFGTVTATFAGNGLGFSDLYMHGHRNDQLGDGIVPVVDHASGALPRAPWLYGYATNHAGGGNIDIDYSAIGNPRRWVRHMPGDVLDIRWFGPPASGDETTGVGGHYAAWALNAARRLGKRGVSLGGGTWRYRNTIEVPDGLELVDGTLKVIDQDPVTPTRNALWYRNLSYDHMEPEDVVHSFSPGMFPEDGARYVGLRGVEIDGNIDGNPHPFDNLAGYDNLIVHLRDTPAWCGFFSTDHAARVIPVAVNLTGLTGTFAAGDAITASKTDAKGVVQTVTGTVLAVLPNKRLLLACDASKVPLPASSIDNGAGGATATVASNEPGQRIVVEDCHFHDTGGSCLLGHGNSRFGIARLKVGNSAGSHLLYSVKGDIAGIEMYGFCNGAYCKTETASVRGMRFHGARDNTFMRRWGQPSGGHKVWEMEHRGYGDAATSGEETASHRYQEIGMTLGGFSIDLSGFELDSWSPIFHGNGQAWKIKDGQVRGPSAGSEAYLLGESGTPSVRDTLQRGWVLEDIDLLAGKFGVSAAWESELPVHMASFQRVRAYNVPGYADPARADMGAWVARLDARSTTSRDDPGWGKERRFDISEYHAETPLRIGILNLRVVDADAPTTRISIRNSSFRLDESTMFSNAVIQGTLASPHDTLPDHFWAELDNVYIEPRTVSVNNFALFLAVTRRMRNVRMSSGHASEDHGSASLGAGITVLDIPTDLLWVPEYAGNVQLVPMDDNARQLIANGYYVTFRNGANTADIAWGTWGTDYRGPIIRVTFPSNGLAGAADFAWRAAVRPF